MNSYKRTKIDVSYTKTSTGFEMNLENNDVLGYYFEARIAYLVENENYGLMYYFASAWFYD